MRIFWVVCRGLGSGFGVIFNVFLIFLELFLAFSVYWVVLRGPGNGF